MHHLLPNTVLLAGTISALLSSKNNSKEAEDRQMEARREMARDI